MGEQAAPILPAGVMPAGRSPAGDDAFQFRPIDARVLRRIVAEPERASEESEPAAVWMKVNGPVGGFDRIQKLVRAGFIVRTPTDGDTLQARTNNPTQPERAFASGAQFLSTDYPEPIPAFSNYRVRFDGGIVVRNNPVNGNPALNRRDLEK